MLAFLRRPRTQRLREYERQLAVQVTVFAIAKNLGKPSVLQALAAMNSRQVGTSKTTG